MLRRRSSLLVVVLAFAACRGGATPASCPAKLVIGAQDDVARYASCRTAASLTVRTAGEIDLQPLGLERVDGDVTIGPSVGLAEATLAKLATVGGTIRVVSNADLGGAYFPALGRAGSVVVENCGRMKMLALPVLAELGGDLRVSDDLSLEMLEASRLTTIGGDLALANLPELTLVEMGGLARVSAVRIDATPRIPEELVTRLRTLGK